MLKAAGTEYGSTQAANLPKREEAARHLKRSQGRMKRENGNRWRERLESKRKAVKVHRREDKVIDNCRVAMSSEPKVRIQAESYDFESARGQVVRIPEVFTETETLGGQRSPHASIIQADYTEGHRSIALSCLLLLLTVAEHWGNRSHHSRLLPCLCFLQRQKKHQSADW